MTRIWRLEVEAEEDIIDETGRQWCKRELLEDVYHCLKLTLGYRCEGWQRSVMSVVYAETL